jgi:hypothetical protein
MGRHKAGDDVKVQSYMHERQDDQSQRRHSMSSIKFAYHERYLRRRLYGRGAPEVERVGVNSTEEDVVLLAQG